MKSVSKFVLAFALVAIVAGSAWGQDAEKKKKGPARRQVIAAVVKKVEAAGLTEEQKTNVNAIADEYGPKYIEQDVRLTASLSKEQKKARKEAQAKVKTDGLKGKQAADAVAAAVKLTDDQKKLESEIKEAQKKLTEELTTAVMNVLTPEQKEKLASENKKKKAK